MEKNYVLYEDFGAVGDGIADDTEAIRAAHSYANERLLPVIAKASATYYIKDCKSPIIIKCDVDFSGAKFIMDDRGIERGSDNAGRIFYVAPDHEKETVTDREAINATYDEIRKFCDERKFVIYYTRVWNEPYNNVMMTKFDVGSHTEFFYLDRAIDITALHTKKEDSNAPTS